MPNVIRIVAGSSRLSSMASARSAREAGFSEGALFKHFDSKEDLFLHVLAERLPSFVALSKELPGRGWRGWGDARGGGEAVTAYLRAEQRLGRVREDADPEAAAAMLLGACFQRVFLRQFLAEEVDSAEEERFARDVVGTLMRSLSPGGD